MNKSMREKNQANIGKMLPMVFGYHFYEYQTLKRLYTIYSKMKNDTTVLIYFMLSDVFP